MGILIGLQRLGFAPNENSPKNGQKGIDNISVKRYTKRMGKPIELPTLKCLRCNHVWVPNRPVEPKVCPKCNSPYWNRPRRRGIKP